jgi:hypothetical protein
MEALKNCGHGVYNQSLTNINDSGQIVYTPVFVGKGDIF